MKTLKIILIGLFGLLTVLILVAFCLPGKMDLERSIEIEAPAAVIYGAVTDLKVWAQWEPWGPTDESMVMTYGEKTVGVGASYNWEGSKTGVGNLEIIEVDPLQMAKYKLVFDQNEAQPAYASITITSLGKTVSKVTWRFQGDLGSNPLGRYIGLLVKTMVGKSYEVGLQNLKTLTEASVVPETVPANE